MTSDSKVPSARGKAYARAAHTLVVALGLVACSDATGPGAAGPTLRIEPVADSVFEGDTVRLTARVFDQGGVEVLGAPVTWAVGDTTLAAFVEPDVLLLRRPGTVRITAHSGAAVDTYDLGIGRLVVQRVELTPDAIIMGRTDHLEIAVHTLGQGGREITGRVVTFTADDTLVAIAPGPTSALLIAVAAGSTTIRANVDGVTGAAAVDVVAVDTTLSLTQYEGAPVPVLVEADTVVTGGLPLVYEIYADGGTLILSGLLQKRYQLGVTYSIYRLVPDTDPAERTFVARISAQSDRGLVTAGSNGSLSMVSEVFGPHLEHTAAPQPDGYLVRYRIPGENAWLDLWYSRQPSQDTPASTEP
jgi:hypothetical protein